MTYYDYGNTRLRAREAALLRGEQYTGLLGRDLPGVLAGLASTAYRPHVDAVTAEGHRHLDALYRVARAHLVAALAGIPAFYRGRAHQVVAALFARFDVDAVLAVLRARHHGIAADLVGAGPPALGQVDPEILRQAARQPDLPAAAAFLAERGLPDPTTAVVLRKARHRYEVDTDLARFEAAVAHAAHAHQLSVLVRAGRDAEPALAAFRRETDDRNLLLALRLREAAIDQNARGERAEGHLPGGVITGARLLTIAGAGSRAEVLAALPTGYGRRDCLRAWAEGGDLAALHTDLATERLRGDLRLLRRDGQAGAATVLRYLLAHQAQARNLRLIAQVAAGLLAEHEARRQLVMPT
jgi:vacuolar-type H+-ATPase subunit C/Vma6